MILKAARMTIREHPLNTPGCRGKPHACYRWWPGMQVCRTGGSPGVGEGLPYIVPVWRAVASGGLLETDFSEQGQAVRVRMPECVRSLVHWPQVIGDKRPGRGSDAEGVRVPVWAELPVSLLRPWQVIIRLDQKTMCVLGVWLGASTIECLNAYTPHWQYIQMKQELSSLLKCPIHALYPESVTHCKEEILKGISSTIAEQILKGEFPAKKQ